ncbi:GmrSD restriction endonuclease domain-containing protein [Bifidobacterium ruminantium]|uniref:GmrSD restriction endonuclease domain-containing protein n=1 Tax=Bifidobacterium ruminantium TaxID=78346 RepID=UPI00248FB066|nr:DUF1524 domain-containing protein [Bifidobacterium ruminantium]
MTTILSGLLAASLLVGLPVGSAFADEPTDGTGAGQSATEVLDTLEVKGRAPKTGYKRTQFGKAWADVDHNGCDTRNDILNRDLTGVKYKWFTHKCVVKSGTLHDPYTGKDIKFKKGKKTSTAVQIDHVVALSDAWQKGAQKLSKTKRTELANDPYNLLAVQGRANQKKSDGDAATWLPSNKGFRCEYVARQIGVKHKYSLWVTKAEKEAMAKVLSSCPTQTIPDYTGTGGSTTETTEESEQTDQSDQQDAQTQDDQSQSEEQTQQSDQQTSSSASTPAPAQEPAPAPQQQDVYYQNCTAARAAGAAPIYQGQPGYRSQLDRDHDGVACE